ncbi:MAG: hypothetical protein KME16_11110 [Scytolyngbya sp. HA4215-MV1]|jgi:hypothetical protein|nr:hypothetical protein [Scytolyngbya sp. HA4215-MV1]
MSQDFRFILPLPQASAEVLEAHQLAQDFRREVYHREALEQYCQWYYATAKKHQQELVRMRSDFNFLNWFYRKLR